MTITNNNNNKNHNNNNNNDHIHNNKLIIIIILILAGRVRRLIGSLCIYILSLGCPLGVFGARLGHFGSAIGPLWGAFGPTGVSLGPFGRPLEPPWPAWKQPLDFNEKWTSLCEQTGRSAAACAQDIASRNSSPDCAPSHWAASPQPAHRIKPRVQKVDVTFRANGPFCRSLRTKYSLAELNAVCPPILSKCLLDRCSEPPFLTPGARMTWV